MPTIGQITRPKLVQANVDLGDGDVMAVTFDRNRVTPAWINEAQKRAEDEDALALAAALASVIHEWDVTADDGSPFPPVTDNIAVLSYMAAGELVAALIEASAPSRAEGNSSPNTSSPPSEQTASDSSSSSTPPPSPNGPATSPSPLAFAYPSPT